MSLSPPFFLSRRFLLLSVCFCLSVSPPPRRLSSALTRKGENKTLSLRQCRGHLRRQGHPCNTSVPRKLRVTLCHHYAPSREAACFWEVLPVCFRSAIALNLRAEQLTSLTTSLVSQSPLCDVGVAITESRHGALVWPLCLGRLWPIVSWWMFRCTNGNTYDINSLSHRQG